VIQLIDVLDEPRLEFAYDQGLVDPHDGLAAFGPYDVGLSSRPRNISIAAVGGPDGLQRLENFLRCLNGPLPTDERKRWLWPAYPGFEAAFDSALPSTVAASRGINIEELELASRLADPNQRVASVVDHYLKEIEALSRRDENYGVVVCVVPDFVYASCRPLSRVVNPHGERLGTQQLRERRLGQLEIFDQWDPHIYDFALDFRNQIKARSMAFAIPIQIILESTLQAGEPVTRRERLLTPLSDRAWNLSVALYYKAGGKPWRLMDARPGVCYIGLAYRRRDPSAESRTACCAAQMFLDTGDGIVFLGEPGPWYSPERHQCHLSADAARELLSGVLKTYTEQGGEGLTEIFLHCNSGFDEEEFRGFQSACPTDAKLVAVRVQQERHSGVKLYREGTRPVLRGTLWKVGSRSAYLWGSGFKPRLRTYDGGETPVPIRIDVQYGDADLQVVARDILALTKLNYNACKLGKGEPVTVGFSKAVGEILVSNPGVTRALPQFKYYI
jgi:hypothetical protein